MLAQLQKEHPNVYFISLTIEEKDTKARVQDWLKNKARAPSLNFGKASRPVFERLARAGNAKVGVVPTSIFITAEGKLMEVKTGSHGDEALRKAVSLIAE